MGTGKADTRRLVELQQLQRELIEQRYLRRVDGLERASEAVRRLGEIGSPAGLIARSAEELGVHSAFDRVLVSRLEPGGLWPLAGWPAPGERDLDELIGRPIALGYPLIDDEVARRREAAIVAVADSGPRALVALAQQLGWRSYVVAAIAVEQDTVGLLHAHRGTRPPLDELDRDVAALYAEGLGQAFERAVLREKLGRQRRQLESAAQWINGRILDLSAEERPHGERDAAGDGAAELSAILTPREAEVMRLIARGLSNRTIAATLLLREGTVKYHVKNILRKLQARSRTEAVSRYMELSGGSPSP